MVTNCMQCSFAGQFSSPAWYRSRLGLRQTQYILIVKYRNEKRNKESEMAIGKRGVAQKKH